MDQPVLNHGDLRHPGRVSPPRPSPPGRSARRRTTIVRAQIEAGRFQSVDEVVVEALRLLQEREELFASHRDELRAQIAEGVAAEERGELRDGGEAIAAVRRRGP